MRRDTIFYQLFQQLPTLLFEFIPQPPENAQAWVYLDELGEIAELPTGLGLMVLTTLEGEEAKTQARGLVDRSRDSRAIIDLVSTIIVYKFTNLSRDEVDVMLGVTLQQTRVYQEARLEGKVEGLAEGEIIGEAKGEAKGEARMIVRQLNRRLGSLSTDVSAQIQQLTIPQMEALGEALLDFTSLVELEGWLRDN